MQKETNLKFKIQVFAITAALAFSYICEPVYMLRTGNAVELEDTVDENTEIDEIVEVEDEIIEETVEEVVEEEIIEESEIDEDYVGYTEEEIDLIALVVMAEAEGEPEKGKRLVADVILNRVDSSKFPDTVEGVIYQKNQFEAMWNGRVDRCEVREDIRELVREEMISRLNSKVLYFRTKHYHNFGTPELSVGNHYFSS